MKFNDEAIDTLKAFDDGLGIPEEDENLFGRNRSALRMIIDKQTGLQAMNLPSRVILDDNNNWNFIVNITSGMNGIAYCPIEQHNTGMASYASGGTSSDAPVRQE